MSRFDEILDNIFFPQGKDKFNYNRIFVVSAYGGVTNLLLEHKKSNTSGIYSIFEKQEDYDKGLKTLSRKLMEINQGFADLGLDLKAANEFIETRIHDTKKYLDSLAHILASGYVVRENLLLAARELLAAIGEAHSAFNTSNILNNLGIKSTFIDFSGLHDDDLLTIDDRIKIGLKNIDFSKTVPILTGYIKGVEGIMREFDRGYTEVTFSKVAVFAKVDEAVIHKEFHLCSADPQVVGEKNVRIVGNTNYDVADQLADVGMEAIHPKAAKPLEMNGISLRMKNAFDPGNDGTLFTKDYVGTESKVEMITGSNEVCLIEVHDPKMVGMVGFDLEVMKIFLKYNLSYILKATNANSISHIVWEKHISKELMDELKENYEQVIKVNVAVVCAIGSNIAKPGVLEMATRELAKNGINIIVISQSMRQVNMQFVIERDDFEKAIKSLNQALCGPF